MDHKSQISSTATEGQPNHEVDTRIHRCKLVPSSPNRASDQFTDSLKESIRDPWRFISNSNSKALPSKFIQFLRKPEHLAPVILDFLSLSLSIIRTGWQPGPDLIYPLSCLQKQKSGRLARLLLEHSRDQQLRNLHNASSPRDGVDPPRVAVIDFDEVPPEIIERGYTVSADFYDFVVMVIFLQMLISPSLHTFSPHYEWLGRWMTSSWFGAWAAFYVGLVFRTVIQWTFGDWFGAASWVAFYVGLVARAVIKWTIRWTCNIIASFFLCIYAIIRGEGTLTLVRRSDISTRGYAVLLDHDFTVILTGTQNVVEAIAESHFSMSHIIPRRYQPAAWGVCRSLCYQVLEASCRGLPHAILLGFLLQCPSPSKTFVPWVPTMVSCVKTFNYTTGVLGDIVSSFSNSRILTLTSIYELAIEKDPLLLSAFQPTIFLYGLQVYLLIIYVISSQDYRIRTAKLLDILGHPPVRRWEFDTLAASATFRCLVLCRGIPRPVKIVDMVTLLDTFVPDQTDVWNVWKARVADRIAHEEDISFAPTLPSFGDRRQKRLKELLDEAQIGYGVYMGFYD